MQVVFKRYSYCIFKFQTLQAKRDEQMLKRRNVNFEPESPLAESNKQVCVRFLVASF